MTSDNIPPVNTRPTPDQIRARHCPHCGAPAGHWCRTPSGPTRRFHASRVPAAATRSGPRPLNVADLLHLVDRAERGTLLAPEAVVLRAGIRALADQAQQDRRTAAGLQGRLQLTDKPTPRRATK